ncbi:MAG TPA: DUF1501 domain-containing protein [Bryobacteraceae bacterium]|jgi:uncharacterized protein (DUF1501 family)|nr:DUF1501 domain-containing protein [Bryobacteraceae bacterium]
MSNEKRILTRRSMLATGWAALAGSALAATQASSPAGELPTQRTQTLVCIYLFGGSDGNTLIAPLEPSQYDKWAKERGELGTRADALLPIRSRSNGVTYGLHPALLELQRHFDEGVAAVVANVGPSVRPDPASNSRYGSISFLSDGYSTVDWAARKAGARLDNDVAFTFATGVDMLPIGDTRFEGPRRQNPLLLEKIAGASFKTVFPDSIIGRQLRNVAGLIQARSVTKSPRQVVFCPFGGFGTSTAQMKMQLPLYRQLSQAMSAFYRATVEMGLAGQVTTFTDSEFGRTLRPNSNHGANPGWGNHQFVLGGAVKGGDIYGQFPDMIAGPFASDGALRPTTSTSQYQATMASWLGISPAELPALLPDLNGAATLSFLGA